jgi:hypothetical protein
MAYVMENLAPEALVVAIADPPWVVVKLVVARGVRAA